MEMVLGLTSAPVNLESQLPEHPCTSVIYSKSQSKSLMSEPMHMGVGVWLTSQQYAEERERERERENERGKKKEEKKEEKKKEKKKKSWLPICSKWRWKDRMFEIIWIV